MASGVGPGEHGEKSGIWIINVLTATPRQIRGNAEGAVPSPDGSLIAFRSNIGESSISVVDTGGENLRVLATASLNENFGQLQWSPDGTHIGFIVRGVGDPMGSIDAIDVASGKRTELTRKLKPRTFAWLPDDRLIVATDEADDSGTVLREIDRQGRDHQLGTTLGSKVAEMSMTADGTRLVLVRTNEQSDIYETQLSDRGLAAEPKRITLDDRDDQPSAWLPDSKTFIFASNRNGNFDLFKQKVDSAVAEQLASGPDQQLGAQLTPERSHILYWSLRENGQQRLLRMPVTGGPAETIFDLPARSEFVCPTRAPAASDCVLARFTDGSLSLESFNWKTGERQRLADIQNGSKAGSFPWMVSPDASQVATAEGNYVRVVDLKGGRSRIVGESAGTPTGICPGLAANEWIIATASSRENVLAALGPSGTRKLWSSSRVIGSPLLAPDGKRLLLQISTATSNAWMIEIR